VVLHRRLAGRTAAGGMAVVHIVMLVTAGGRILGLLGDLVGQVYDVRACQCWGPSILLFLHL